MFLRVIVTRHESTELYIEVPDDFDSREIMKEKHQNRVAEIADETTDDSDWDSSEWQDTVEVQGVSVVSEKEAKKYRTANIAKPQSERT